MSGRHFIIICLLSIAPILCAQTSSSPDTQTPNTALPPVNATITNAADHYNAAFNLLTLSADQQSLLHTLITTYTLGQTLSESDLSAAQNLLKSSQNAIITLRSINPDLPTRWPRDLTNASTYNQPLPHLPNIKHTASLIHLDALIAAHLKDNRRLTADLLHLITLSQSLAADEHIPAVKTRIEILLIFAQLEHLLPLNILTPNQLRDIQRKLYNTQLIPQAKAAILYQRSQALIYTRDYITDLIDPQANLTPDELSSNKQTLTRLTTEFLLRLDNYDFNYSDLLKQTQQLPDSEILSKNLLPQYIRLVSQDLATAQARLNTFIVALALQRYQLTNGSYPTSLEPLTPDLLPNIPIDPFNRSPLRYKHTQNAVVIYALGPDHLDNQARAYTSNATPTFGYLPASPPPSYIYTDITFNLGPYQQINFPQSLAPSPSK
ncbi:hypothetical protein KS4_21600 [Poriferisphaera corsica]|uniref:Uncharacterized protein n=1 Tax=Poriferisphaera corsica TaxID=2528020 RepID=A0A517YV23_9BACT|nr:hypothetical protein [Poriferisphaera corsica]QDU34098.1 hypothetical protein KS4_21600 [Poriferisphaera corsica]